MPKRPETCTCPFEADKTGTARLIRAALLASVLALVACGNTPTEPTNEQHGPEGGGMEAGESGTQYGLTDTAMETRAGVDLVMSFDQGAQRFNGTVTNTTGATVAQVRVEIHLSNGVELGPTPRVDLAAGQVRDVTLDAAGQTFDSWSVHVEIGSSGA